jgi:hypothetical protein
MKTVPRCCLTCALWDKAAALNAAGRLRRDKTARCLWQSTEPYPASTFDQTRPRPSFMASDWGTDCVCWVARDEN